MITILQPTTAIIKIIRDIHSQERVSSNSIVATAALTLRESTNEDGNSSGLFLLMVNTILDYRARCGDTPLPSDPTNTRLFIGETISFLKLSSVTNGTLLFVCLVPVQITCPCFFHFWRNPTGSATECMLMSSSAPELVLLTVEFSGQRFLLPTSKQPI